MIIFLFGQDIYRLQEKLKEITEHYKKVHKSGLNLIQIDAKKTTVRDFIDILKITPMFAETKLIILKNVFSSANFQEEFLKEAKGLMKLKDVIIVFEEDNLDERNKLFQFLKKEAKSQEFKPIDGQKLKDWVEKEFKKYNTSVEPVIIQTLINFVGNDLWQMANEIKKLVSFRDGKKIKTEDINLLVRPKIENDIFKTIDAIAQKNKKQALGLLQKHLEEGDHPLYLLSMINFQFRNLLIVKDLIEKHNPYNVIIKKSRLHPFVVKKSYFQAQKFTLEELKKIYQKIFDTDLKIKTGQIEPEMALELLVAGI